jgi:hypothetical protein
MIWNWVPVTHTCNPSYLGGRDQADNVSKPAWSRPYSQANNLQIQILKIPNTKKRAGVAQVAEFKPQYHQKY